MRGVEEAKQQVRGREPARDGDSAVLQVRKLRPGPGDDERTAAPAERAAGTEQGIVLAKMAQRMVGDLGEVQPAIERHAVQGFHILELFAKRDPGTPTLPWMRP